MQDDIKRMDYYRVIIDEEVGGADGIIRALLEAGVNLLGFSGVPEGEGASQLDLFPESPEIFDEAVQKLGLGLTRRQSGFLIQGEDRPTAVGEVLSTLSKAGIVVTALQYVAAGDGRYGALLCVKPSDSTQAGELLHAAVAEPDALDEASEELFPPGDAPAWVPA